MMIPLYQIDAFTERLFGGNYAGVCPLEHWLPDELMQAIAAENNLPETAFIGPDPEGLRIRWFSPLREVALCGHATLAAAHVYFTHLGFAGGTIRFMSMSGPLAVRRAEKGYTLDFPTDDIARVQLPEVLRGAFRHPIVEVYKGRLDYLVVLESETQVENEAPDLEKVAGTGTRGVIITAPGGESDFVSRYFAPQFGIPEDPVTGSAHTTLMPYWASRLGRTSLTAIQLSARRGHLDCELRRDRTLITGSAVTYMIGSIQVP